MQSTVSDRLVKKTAVPLGQYLYAVIDCDQTRAFDWPGLDGAAIRALTDGRVAAVVSEMPNTMIRPERRRLATHHDVLKRLREQFTVLPAAFGVIAESATAVHHILVRNRDAFLKQIRRVADKVEMGLRVSWDVPNIFEYFVESHPELRELRDQLFHDRHPTKGELIDLGRTFDGLLRNERALCTATVSQMLSSRGFEIKENKPRNEQETMNLAVLVGENAQTEFEEGVVETARRFNNSYSFDFNGPWLPYNFVDLNLEL
jgi:hypothetical protein